MHKHMSPHGDKDHLGEATPLLEDFKVEKVIFNSGSYNYLEKDLIKLLKKKRIKYYHSLERLKIASNYLEFLNT